MTFEDAGDVLGMVEAPLLVPDGFKVVAASPTEEQLDPTNPASDALIEQRIMVRFEHYGWCVGTGRLRRRRRRTSRVVDVRRLAVGRVRVVAAVRACAGADGGGGPGSGGRRRNRRRVKRSDRLGPGGGRWAARGDGLWHGPSRRAGAAWMPF